MKYNKEGCLKQASFFIAQKVFYKADYKIMAERKVRQKNGRQDAYISEL